MSRRRHKRRYKRRRRQGCSGLVRDFSSERRHGWGFNLYRNTREGKIAGVCAGLADYWDVEAWVVRILWVVLFLFTGTLALWAYVGMWIFIAPRPRRHSQEDFREQSEADEAEEVEFEEVEVDMEYDEHRHQYRPRKVFRYSDSTPVRLQRARDRLDSALRRVEDMESYVTSRRYQLNKEFSKL